MKKIEKYKIIKELKLRDRVGFSLVEVLLIVAIFVIILAGSVSLVNTMVHQEDLDYKAVEVEDLLAKARNRSMTGFRDDVWGIKVLDNDANCPSAGDCIVMYKGWEYSSRDSGFDQFVDFGENTGVYLESNQKNEFYFGSNSGWLTTSSDSNLSEQLIVLKSNFGEQKSIVIHPTGSVAIFICGDTPVYDTEGNTYQTVKIGSQCWMAESLNTGTMLASAATDPTDNDIVEKWCESDTSSNCDAQGGLYHWDELMGYVTTEGIQGICPAGWHVPSDTEMNTLEANYPSASDGTELKIGGSSGFNLIESNEMNTNTNTYDDADLSAIWTSTIHDSPVTESYVHYTDTPTATMNETTNDQGYGFSLRCLKNY